MLLRFNDNSTITLRFYNKSHRDDPTVSHKKPNKSKFSLWCFTNTTFELFSLFALKILPFVCLFIPVLLYERGGRGKRHCDFLFPKTFAWKFNLFGGIAFSCQTSIFGLECLGKLSFFLFSWMEYTEICGSLQRSESEYINSFYELMEYLLLL